MTAVSSTSASHDALAPDEPMTTHDPSRAPLPRDATSRTGGLAPRERRTILVGLVVSVVALVGVRGVLPWARAWRAREELIAVKRERLARLGMLAGQERALAAAARAREAALGARPQRLLVARTPSLAASALQALLQGYADQARVAVGRIDVAADADSARGALAAVPATIVASGDVYGLSELLSLLEHGPTLLEVTSLGVQSVPGARGTTLLQLTVGVRAPYAPGE